MQGTRLEHPPSSLVFRDRFANEKSPPVISSRLFQREHFVQTACQHDCLLGKSKRRTLDRYKNLQSPKIKIITIDKTIVQ